MLNKRTKINIERDERMVARLGTTHIEGGLPPSLTLLSDLVKFLDGAKTRKGKGVVAILETMLEIEEMTTKMEGLLWPDLSLKKTDPEKFRRQCDVDDRVALLNRKLKKYRFMPHAAVGIGGNSGVDRWAAYFRGDPHEKEEQGLKLMPSQALEVILKLTQIDYLNRVRHCAHCRRWLYARSRHQTFCSFKCQQKSYTQRGVWKAYRRDYMRRRYHQLKENPLKTRKQT